MANHAIRIHKYGGPENMSWEEVETPHPGRGEVLIRHLSIGVNYIDVYHRTGLYPVDTLPFTPGIEAVGVVEEIGEGVDDIIVGERFAYALPPLGAYAEKRIVPAKILVPVLDSISSDLAAASLLRGMTAHYLLHDTFQVRSNQTILIHAVAGGVGQILCQWAKWLGVKVIGTVSTEKKYEIAKDIGCDYPIIYTKENFVDRVKEITDGVGVPVVYDSIGQPTFMDSLSCLHTRGTMVTYGQAGGAVQKFDPSLLAKYGSLFLTRPKLMDYTSNRDELLYRAEALFRLLNIGAIRVDIGQKFELKNAAEAHKALESRQTTGSTILIP